MAINCCVLYLNRSPLYWLLFVFFINKKIQSVHLNIFIFLKFSSWYQNLCEHMVQPTTYLFLPTTMTSLSLNVGNFITLKLNPTNYPLWHEQALAFAERQELANLLTNEETISAKYTRPDSNNSTNTKKFIPKLN